MAIGTIYLRRDEVRFFSEQQIALLQTFADQAVIAIENVRLFKELETRNRELTEALESRRPRPRSCGSSAPRRRISSPCWTRWFRARRASAAATMRTSSASTGTSCAILLTTGRSQTPPTCDDRSCKSRGRGTRHDRRRAGRLARRRIRERS